ncbi:MAG: hypothetical protein KAS76_02645 [Thermoplasmatales archaeon]|nr:hypothetical protein [Thermoplasmatales archaeon]MCK4995620.1 hypothetical protein [Thermoplasmatales archaeon]
MDEKEFSEKLRAHRKIRNKKIISYVFRVALPALIGILIIVIAITHSMGGGATYDISATALHESSIEYYLRDVSFEASHSIFFSKNPEISWSAYFIDDFNSPAPLRFRVRDNTLENSYIDITTSSYQEKLSGVDSGRLNFNWLNEDESQDVTIGARIHYDLDLFWVAFFMFIGIVLIACSCISAQKISNRTSHKINIFKRRE